jgi:hypothetical protein
VPSEADKCTALESLGATLSPDYAVVVPDSSASVVALQALSEGGTLLDLCAHQAGSTLLEQSRPGVVRELKELSAAHGTKPISDRTMLGAVSRALCRTFSYSDGRWKAACYCTVLAVGIEFGASGLLAVPLSLLSGCVDRMAGEWSTGACRRFNARFRRARELVIEAARGHAMSLAGPPKSLCLSRVASVVNFNMCKESWPLDWPTQ